MLTGTAQWDWPRLRARCQREADRLLADADDAEDAVQEALTRAWRKRHSCRTPATPLPWLLQITRNEAFRLMDRRRCEPGSGDEASYADDEAGGELGSDQVAVRVDVRRAVSRLPPGDRVLVHLRYAEDLAHRNIAELLDAPEGTIKVRLHRIRLALRSHLADVADCDQELQ